MVSSRTATASSAAFRSVVGDLAARLRADPGISGVRAGLAPGSPLVSAGGHAALIGLHAASDADIKPVLSTVRAANGAGGFAVAVTGDHAAGHDFTALSSSDLRHGEIDFGLPISIVILMLVFGSVVAGLMPMLMALASIIVGLGIATIVAQEFTLSVFIINMITGMGLALGIDYSLFVISRFREERARGLDKDAAIAMTAATASRAVLFSGTIFVIALLGLFLVPTNVLRSMAAGAIIVGVVSVAAALTLLPAVLSLLGDRVNALRIPFAGTRLGRADAAEGRVWQSVITRVIRRPVVSLAVIGGLMLLAAVPVLGLHIGQSGVATLPDSLPAKQGYLAVARYFPGQDPNPVEIVTQGSSHADHTDLARLQATLAADPRFGPGTIQAAPHGHVLALTAPIQGDAVSSRDVAAVGDLRQHLIPAAFAGSSTQVYVGGKTAETADYFRSVSGATPYVLIFVLGLSFLLLTLAFRSVVVALSIVLNLLSAGAAYGLLTLVFLHGIGAERLRVPAGDRHRRLGAAVPVLGPVRPVHGLSGVPHEPDQGALRPDRLHPRSGHRRSRLHREDHHRGRPHHRRRVQRLRPRATRHVPADGLRCRRRPAPGRHAHPHGHPAQRPQPPRPPQLVSAPMAQVDAPRRGRVARRPGRRGILTGPGHGWSRDGGVTG